MKKYMPNLLGCILIFASCGSDDGGGGETTDVEPNGAAPVAATLVFPENNTECNEGEVLNDTESTVTFEWNTSENSHSYTVNLKNLDTGVLSTTNSNTSSVAITLLRGTPYEWSVISKSMANTTTAESSVWKFYNQGPGVENHAPFPAEAANPKRGASISASGVINLAWIANDIDNDIDTYEVFFGIDRDTMTSLGTITSPSVNDVVINSNTTYYWKVITTDNAENSSISEVFNFNVN